MAVRRQAKRRLDIENWFLILCTLNHHTQDVSSSHVVALTQTLGQIFFLCGGGRYDHGTFFKMVAQD